MNPQPCSRFLNAKNAACGQPATKFHGNFALCDDHVLVDGSVYNSIIPSPYRYCGMCKIKAGFSSIEFHEVAPDDSGRSSGPVAVGTVLLRCPNCGSVLPEGAFPYVARSHEAVGAGVSGDPAPA